MVGTLHGLHDAVMYALLCRCAHGKLLQFMIAGLAISQRPCGQGNFNMVEKKKKKKGKLLEFINDELAISQQPVN